MFYIMMDHEQTADTAMTLSEARQKGQPLCDSEVLPTVFSIYDGENFVEDFKRTDGRDLTRQIADFKLAHS